MITKTASKFINKTGAIGGIYGAGLGMIRGGSLDEQQRQALAQQHGMSADARFGLRNTVRGSFGGAAGSSLGSLGGAAAGARLAGPNPIGMLAGSAIGFLGGGLFGSHMATRKYSPGQANQAIANQNQPSVPQHA